MLFFVFRNFLWFLKLGREVALTFKRPVKGKSLTRYDELQRVALHRLRAH